MKSTFISLLCLLALGAYGNAHATCGTGTAMSSTTGRCEIVQQPASPSAHADSNSSSGSASSSDATSFGSPSNAAANDNSRSGFLSLPAPVSAAPLPAGFCDHRTSSARALGWNLISKADSEARLDVDNLEACERLLRATRALTPQQMAFEHCAGQDDTPGCVARMMHAFTVGQMASPAMVQNVELKAAPALAAPPAHKRKPRRVVLGAEQKSQELCEDGWRAVMKHCPKP